MSEEENKQENQPLKGFQVLNYFVNLFKDFVNLDKGVDKLGTIQSIKAKQSMNGANVWLLICSIVIASIGLNLDSQAVIIGAMLISPLMSPILGMGLAVAINDKDALGNALLHFGAAVVIALVFSTLYFWLIPLDEYTPQIEARTKPTFLDILIGIFGGIAGIVSFARKDISTTIPGVAIATALMPPLCVTGYGLANGDWDAASKSFYLFFLNSFFVALATYLVLRYLKFPYKVYASKKERRKNINRVFIFSFVMTIPSFIIFTNVYKEYVREDKIRTFIEIYVGDDNVFLDNYTLKPRPDGSHTLFLKVYGESIKKSDVPRFEHGLDSLGLKNINIGIIPTSEIPLEKVRQLETGLSEVGDKLNKQLTQLRDERDARQRLLESMNSNPEFLVNDSLSFAKATEELKIFIPEIEEFGLAIVQYSDILEGNQKMPTAIVKWNNNSDQDLLKLEKYIRKHFNLDTIKIVISK